MDAQLKALSDKYNINLTQFKYEEAIDIFINDNVEKYADKKEMFFIIGLYYQYHNKDYYKMLDFYSNDIMNNSNKSLPELVKYFSFTDDGKNDIHFTKYMKIISDYKKGHMPSIIVLSKHYEYMEATYKQQDTSILIEDCYLVGYKKGDVYCMRQLGIFYECFKNKSLSKEEQIKLMKKYYLMAIKSGDAISAYRLACYYYNNKENGYYNENAIKRFFEIAFERGIVKAYYLLGMFYYKRDNSDTEISMTNEDKFELMKKYYLLAIDKGEGNSMYNLGLYYQFNKENGEYKYELMKKYYKMAINAPYCNVDAMYNLGQYYQFNKVNEEYKYGLMKKYYKMAIKKCNIKAMNNLGYYYIEIEKKPILGIKYVELGVKHNDSFSMNNLGKYYRHIQNIELMIKYYTLSCYQNDAEGMYLLGNYYESIKDYENMEKYYKMAIERNHERAKKQMDEYNAMINNH